MKLTGVLLAFAFAISAAASAETASNWADRINVNGDFRFRHDYDSQTSKTDDTARHRERYRLRLGVQGKINDTMTAKVRLAGSDGDDPLSTNDTMTSNAQPKAFYIDQAMVEWKMCDKMTFHVGKQANPFQLIGDSQLLYDSDYNPEGASLLTNFNSLFLNLGAYSLQERHTTGDHTDSGLLVAMLGYKTKLQSGLGFTVAAGYHDFTDLKNRTVLAGGDYGNSVNGSGGTATYINDYQVGELLAEANMTSGNLKYGVYVDTAENFAITKNNKGFLAGAKLQTLNDGKAAWSFAYTYESNNKDTTVSAINNSDFADGKDGSVGHMFSVGHPLAANTSVSLLYMHAKIDNGGNPYSSDRGFLDFNFVF